MCQCLLFKKNSTVGFHFAFDFLRWISKGFIHIYTAKKSNAINIRVSKNIQRRRHGNGNEVKQFIVIIRFIVRYRERMGGFIFVT